MLEIKNGNFVFIDKNNQTPILKNINLLLKENTAYAIIGLNGSGKTTLLKILSGRIQLSSGSTLFREESCSYQKRQYLKHVGWVNQEPLLDNKLSCLETLSITSRIYGLTTREFNLSLDYLVRHLDLTELLNKKISMLSGGQKRRIDIARSLIHNPKWLFLDEPSAGLDPLYFHTFWDFLMAWQKENRSTIVSITHNIKEAELLQNLIVVSNGNIIFNGQYLKIMNQLPTDMIDIETLHPEELHFNINQYLINSNSIRNNSILTKTNSGLRIGSNDSKVFIDFLTSSDFLRTLWFRFSITQRNLSDVIAYAENLQ